MHNDMMLLLHARVLLSFIYDSDSAAEISSTAVPAQVISMPATNCCWYKNINATPTTTYLTIRYQ